MLAIERKTEILEKLQKERKVVVSELSKHYKVSEETIRRDLEKLEKEGYAVKSYGGAVINENTDMELPFNVRKNCNVVGKQRIAALICELVNDGEKIILDASSTSVFIAKALKEKKQNLTVITNSVEILVELFDVPGWNVFSTGGAAKGRAFALIGMQTDEMLKNYHVDKTIISCKGLHTEAGVTDSDEVHAKNKRTMLGCGRQHILAVDSSKFNETAFTKIAELPELDIIVTDQRPPARWLKHLEQIGVACMYPEQ